MLEKHRDFLRDFRGDTIHPSTLDVIDQLGLGEDFDKLPHTKVYGIGAVIGDRYITLADFRMLHRKRDYIAFLPQWDFLSFLVGRARVYPGFHLHMETEATALIDDSGEVTRICARGPLGKMEIQANLTVAADGRTSTLRDGYLRPEHLQAVPKRRLWSARVTQSAQRAAQQRIISAVLAEDEAFKAPLALCLFDWLPVLRAIPAWLIGLGVRPEKVERA